MIINTTMLTTAINVATEIYRLQTAPELETLKWHQGKAFDESKIVAEIAVKMILRLGNIKTAVDDLRVFSPIDVLVIQAVQTYRERYGV
jgi:hypothetical protein